MKSFFHTCLIAFCLLPTADFLIPTVHAQNTDIDLLYSINSNNSPSWDKTNQAISMSMAPLSIAVPIGFFAYGVLAPDSVAKRNSIVMGAGLAVSGILTMAMKYGFNRTRPYNEYPFIVKKGEGGGPSFPSGHTSSAFATATSLSLCYPKWHVIAPAFIWASAVGYSRMELGVHYPSDVLVGAIIGAGCSWVMWKANKKQVSGKK